MKWKKLKKREAESIMNSWEIRPTVECDSEFNALRNDLLFVREKFYFNFSDENNTEPNSGYRVDLNFGMELYLILTNTYQFTIRQASDDEIWRYLSMCVVPDIVFARWGMSPDRFWKEQRRVWLKTLWWYIHLSWQGNNLETFKILKENTTDEIVQMVERSGKFGYRIDVSRAIMKYYGEMEKQKKKDHPGIFRKVMKLNTARTRVIEPSLMDGGETAYVKELFEYFELQ